MKRLLIVLVVFLLIVSGCDGTSWENKICAKSYPQENVLSIPVQARLNQGDYLAYGGYHFSAEPMVVQNVNNWAVLQGMNTLLFEDAIGTGVVIEKEGNYYFLGPMSCEEDNIFEFSGMQRSIKTTQGSLKVLLPLHLLSDPFIRSSLSARIKTGELYRIKNDVCAIDETVELFLSFYETIYGNNVSREKEKIVLTGDHGEVEFSFYKINEEHCFSVDVKLETVDSH